MRRDAEGCVLASTSAPSEDTAEEAGRGERGEGSEERGERESEHTGAAPSASRRPGRKQARWSILRIFEKSGLSEGARGAPAAEAPPAGLPRRPFIEA